jgi:hypothetical protein
VKEGSMTASTLHRPPKARITLRLQGFTSLIAGVALLVAAVPLARAMGVARPGAVALAGVFFTIFGADALGSAVARRLRRVNVLPFAVVDAACAAGILLLLAAGSSAFTSLGLAILTTGAATLGWFALTGFRATRAL